MKVKHWNWNAQRYDEVEYPDAMVQEFVEWFLHTTAWPENPELVERRVRKFKQDMAEYRSQPAPEPVLPPAASTGPDPADVERAVERHAAWFLAPLDPPWPPRVPVDQEDRWIDDTANLVAATERASTRWPDRALTGVVRLEVLRDLSAALVEVDLTQSHWAEVLFRQKACRERERVRQPLIQANVGPWVTRRNLAEQFVDVLVGKARHDDIEDVSYGADKVRIPVVQKYVEIAVGEVAFTESDKFGRHEYRRHLTWVDACDLALDRDDLAGPLMELSRLVIHEKRRVAVDRRDDLWRDHRRTDEV